MTIPTRNPAAVSVPTTSTTVGPLDRAAAPVNVSTDPELPQPRTSVTRPTSVNTTVTASSDPGIVVRTPVVVANPTQEVPVSTSSDPGLTTGGNNVVVSVPVQEIAVSDQTESIAPNVPVDPVYINVRYEGTTVISQASTLNFLGNGVSISGSGSQANITITASGGSGNYGNSNVVSLLSSFGSNTISTTGNITAGYLFGNGSQLTGIVSSYGNSNVAAYLASGTNSSNIVTTANVSGANLITGGVVTATGNVRGANFNTAGVVSATGNITGNYFIGNGSLLTGISSSANTGNVGFDNYNIYNTQGGGLILSNFNFITAEAETAYVQIPAGNSTNDLNVVQEQGNVRLVANTAVWNFDTAGNLTIPNGGYINFVNTGGITQAVNEDLRFTVSDDEQDGWAIQSTVNDGAGNDLTRMQVRYDGVRINTDLPTNNYSWDFRDSGEFDVPKSIRGPVGGNLVISIGDQSGSNTFIDLQTRSYVGDALISNIRIGDPNVTISTANGAQNWSFGSTGTITLPNGGNIRSVDELTIINSTTTANGIIGINAREQSTGDSVAQVYLDGTDRVVRVSTYNPNTEIGYDWTFDAGGSFTLPTSPGNVYFGTNTNGPVIIADSLGITLNANRADTAQEYVTVSQDGVNIFSVNTINIENNTTGLLNSDINLRSGDDILLQGRDKPDDTENEGGDININGGDGSNSTGPGNDTGGGGDVQIYGGLGGSGTGAGAGSAGAGGSITIAGGDGGTSVDSNVGAGGAVNITAGSAQGAANTAVGGLGGDVNISAGDTTRINEIGGSITLNTGSASGDGTGAAGYVEINIPSSNVGPGGTWTFSGTGTELNVPGNSSIFGANFGNFTVGCAGNTIVTSSVYGSGNVKNWVFGSTGDLTLPAGGNINAGTANTTVALNAYSPAGNIVSVQTQGNTSSAVISIFSNAGPVTSNWTFTTAPLDPSESFLYIPNGGTISTPDATGGQGGKNIFIQAGASDPVTWNSNPGGELMLKGGYGSFGDGGGGPGGDVNIEGGPSSDSHAGNVNISSGLNTWVFDYTGNLSLPPSGNIVGLTANNSGYLNWFGNSSGDGNGYTTLRLVPDDTRTGSDQYLIIDPTAPGHIHIRAGGTQDNSGADLFLGGENSYFKIAAGSNSQATISSNSNAWVFNTDGNLQVPGNINGDNSAPLFIDGASSGEGFIRLPSASFGGEQVAIVNQFSSGNGIALTTNGGTWHFGNTGAFTTPGPISLAVYANATVRDSSITSPTPGMMIYVTGTGMQVRGATSWNTVAGTGT